MMKKKVLLFTSSFMDIYKDVIHGLENLNFEATWCQASIIPNNPFNRMLGLYTPKNVESYLEKVEQLWMDRFKEDKFNQKFDYFLAINGLDIHPCVFEFYKRKNPNLVTSLFLYDRIDGVIQIDCFFKYYDRIYSFDKHDCERFGLNFLPIYWTPSLKHENIIYDVFGFATYSSLKPERTELYKNLRLTCQSNHISENIKLYKDFVFVNTCCFYVKFLIRKVLWKEKESLSDLKSGLYANHTISPDEFRSLIEKSDVIIDTQATYQDGLTARFMWALGLGKKIITTNIHIKDYPFYDPNQFYIIGIDNYQICDFIKQSFEMSSKNRKLILSFRLDNWLKTLLRLE